MSHKTIQLSFFIVFTVIVSVMLFFVLKPYLGVIFISGIFAVVFYPIYEKFVAKLKGKKNFASLITTILILIFIILPVVALSTLLFKESVNLYNSIAFNGSSQNIISQVNVLLNKFSSLISPDIVGSEINLALYARNVLNWIISNFDSIFAAVFGGILNLILMLVSLYYLFIFGGKIKKGLITWSPLPDEYDEEFIKTLKTSIDAVLRGRLLVALVQGAFIGVGFAIFGIGSPILWGFVGALASFVPILGTSIITVPAIAYLLLTNHIGAAIGLLIWAAIAVGLIDNFVSMIFFRNKIQVHPLIVLFSILGGIEVFGIIGFLIGPVVVSAFIALMKIYPFIMFYKKQSANDENIEINSGGSI